MMRSQAVALWFAATLFGPSSAPTHAGTVLAVGTNWGQPTTEGGFESAAIAFRYDGSAWQESRLPVTATGALRGVIYTQPRTALAFGLTRQGSPLLLKTTDDGVSWSDTSNALPLSADGRVAPVDIEILADGSGWLVGVGEAGGPLLSHTSDAGATWSDYRPNRISFAGSYALQRHDDDVYLMRNDSNGVSYENLDDPSQRQALSGSGEFHAAALTVVGPDVWVVGFRPQESDGGEGSLPIPAVSVIPQGRAGLTAQARDLRGWKGHLRSASFLNASYGAVGGASVEGDSIIRPLLLTTDDGAASWHAATLPSEPTARR